MPLTQHCDIFAAIDEDAFNVLALHVALQRPSLFNYGTQSFITDLELFCEPIPVAPGLPLTQPRATKQEPLPIPGTDGRWALEYCMQLTRLQLDLHPGSEFALPPEIGQLEQQGIALRGRVCAAIACPDHDLFRRAGMTEAGLHKPLDPRELLERKQREGADKPPLRTIVMPPGERPHCFCVDLFATLRLNRQTGALGPVLGLELRNLELVDIAPPGLENSLECLIFATIALGVLPKMRIALNDIVLDLGKYGNLTLGLTPTSAGLPFNPDVANDRISVCVDVN